MSACHRCGRELTWAISERNKRMPLEPAEITCPHCDGIGHLRNWVEHAEKKTCPGCNGTGKLERDEGLFVLRRRHRLGPPEAMAVGPALFDTEPKYVFHQCPPEREYSQSLDFPEGF